GRVEVFHSEKWGTVCHDSWDFTDAKVVCRQLGCGAVISAPRRAHFGQGQGPIWLDDVHCAGTEAALSECRSRGWGVPQQDASVVCAAPEVSRGRRYLLDMCVLSDVAGSGISDLRSLRLANGSDSCSGRVEVFHDQHWGGVCTDGWDVAEAHVVCRQLGCGAARSAVGSAQPGTGDGPIWVDGVECTGMEGALLECKVKLWGTKSCKSRGHAGVTCSAAAGQWRSSVTSPGSQSRWHARAAAAPMGFFLIHATAQPLVLGESFHQTISCSVRLVEGPHRCAGRVEVFHNQQWGTVCDNGWDSSDAAVVCRQLGCGAAVSALSLSGFGQGSGPIWLDGVRCLGTEATLAECPVKPWGHHACNHVEDAGVVCSVPSQDVGRPQLPPRGGRRRGVCRQPASLRLADGPHRCAGRVEVLNAEQWGTVCDDSWDLNDAAVVCRQLGCGRATGAHGRARFGQGMGHIWLDDLSCTGSEDNLAQCRAQPWGQNNCNHGEDAGVVC
ncbi:Deleted in malignant brain tumors 1 protein, partial [Tauraco erythrolophus]